MEFQQIPLEQFNESLSLADRTLKHRLLEDGLSKCSDEFFAEAINLLQVEPSVSMKGQFGPNGDTTLSNDWCIIQLGTPGHLIGFDIDTSHFSWYETKAPAGSVEVLYGTPDESPRADDKRWSEVLPKTSLGPNSRHLFGIPRTDVINFVKLKIYPDGGVARFRVYGEVAPVHALEATPFDLAHVFAGGRVVYVSDQHFGVGSNLILPGRGKDMGDGWETKRSRSKGHKDWVIIKLGAPGYLEQVEIDTAHFKGNFPESCEIEATYSETDLDVQAHGGEGLTKLGPHRQHYFQLENVENTVFTHVKMTIYPDGGAGYSTLPEAPAPVLEQGEPEIATPPSPSTSSPSSMVTTIPVLPLTPEAFASFGQVIQGKFHKLSLLQSSYPSGSSATAGISVYRCQPLTEVASDGTTPLKVLERHPYTNQAFIPMGKGGAEGLKETSERYLVVVAQNGADDKPDLKTLRAFWASTAQGVVYGTAIWHQPMTVLDKPLDLACVETQIGDGSAADCEIVELAEVYRLRL
ncbi:allantoicase [Ephemerocybe angulata]|uniref:Allantoicase n=1 Tax=Ephemerocybe angulata TaxID=980116 RepID=A0A8H6MC76_9AGAR|nr:allantoicase [Tulosesus angulatus]